MCRVFKLEIIESNEFRCKNLKFCNGLVTGTAGRWAYTVFLFH